MKSKVVNEWLALVVFCGLGWSSFATADMLDDPLTSKVMIDQLEIRHADDNYPLVFEGAAWAGRDLNKLWLKADVERAQGEIEEAEFQALISRAVASYWDVQVGVRQDVKPGPPRTWAAIGLQGLAPYFFDVNAVLFVGESGRTAARVEAEYELMLTQKWVLSPELEVNFHGQNDPESGVGSGLSNLTAGLRLRYEIVREFAPYVGVVWEKKFGNTAHYADASEEPAAQARLLIGVRAWF